MTKLTTEEAEKIRLFISLGKDRVPGRFAILRPLPDGEVACIVVGYSKKHGVKPVAYWQSDDPKRVFARDIDFTGMAGWIVRWGAAMRRDHCGMYMGFSPRWDQREEDDEYDWPNIKANLMLWTYDVLNIEGLKNTRYKYCGFNSNCWLSFPQFLRIYRQEPKVELLAKAGLWRLISPGKVKAIARSKNLLRFVAQNPGCEFVRWSCVQWAAKHGKTLADAVDRAKAQDELRQYWWFASRWKNGALKKMDKAEARKYCESRGIDPGEYVEYLTLMSKFRPELDLRARTNAYPTNFKRANAAVKRIETIAQMRAEAERKRKAAAELAMRDEHIQKFVDELNSKLGKMKTGDYKILWLTKQDEFQKEGEAMDNCIGGGGYSLAMSRKDCVCFVLVSPGERVDVQIGKDWQVRQCYIKHNLRPSDAAVKVANRIAKRLKKLYVAKAV